MYNEQPVEKKGIVGACKKQSQMSIPLQRKKTHPKTQFLFNLTNILRHKRRINVIYIPYSAHVNPDIVRTHKTLDNLQNKAIIIVHEREDGLNEHRRLLAFCNTNY